MIENGLKHGLDKYRYSSLQAAPAGQWTASKVSPIPSTHTYPDTTVQTCIVHLVRHSLNFCDWKNRKAVAKARRRIYQAVDDQEAAKSLDDFEAEWAGKYPSIAPSWRRA